jgi:hypothetical protein
LNLCTQVNWDDEAECFRTVALVLAEYYGHLATQQPAAAAQTTSTTCSGAEAINTKGAHLSSSSSSSSSNENENGDFSKPFAQLTKQSAGLLSSLLYPAFRQYLIPHVARTADHSVVQIAALEQLYKVFERC